MLAGKLLNAACVGLIVAVISAVNDQVRVPISEFLANPQSLVSLGTGRAWRVASGLNDAVFTYTSGNPSLVLFGLGAVVLAVFMLKS